MFNPEEILTKLNLAEREVCVGLEIILRSHYQLDTAEIALLRAKEAIEKAKELIVESEKLLTEGDVD